MMPGQLAIHVESIKLVSYAKINLMGIKNLDVEQSNAVKLLEEYTEIYLYNTGVRKSVLCKARKVPSTKGKIGKFNYNKVKYFQVKKTNITKDKSQIRRHF